MKQREASRGGGAGLAALGIAVIGAVGLMILGLGISTQPRVAEAAPSKCGDGKCRASHGEDCTTCVLDCGVCPSVCGNGSCELGESCATCESDCGTCAECGDGSCDANETCTTCAADCGSCSSCNNDGVCDISEDCESCAADCGACTTCGDGTCEGTESCSTCPGDCGACTTCGDGTCSISESCINCAADCGTCATHSDFATCPYDMPACTPGANDCCHRGFSAGTIVIPMDRCHQAIDGGGGRRAVPKAPNSYCSDPSPVSGGNERGMFEAYGLVYRLMQQGIPVYWVVNPTKDPPALKESEKLSDQTYHDRDIDAWLLSTGAPPPELDEALTPCGGGGCVPPVLRLSPSDLSPISGSYTKKEFPLRGGAFFIAAEDRARFDEFWTRTGEFSEFAGNRLYDFSDVTLYEMQPTSRVVYLDYRKIGPAYPPFNGGNSAPVAVTLDYDPPRLARQSPANVSSLWLEDARLNEPASYPECLTGNFIPETAVYCDVTEEDIRAGYLIQGNFDWLWLDNWKDGSGCTAPRQRFLMEQLHDFMTGVPGVKYGNSVMFMVFGMESAELCRGLQPLGNPNPSGPGLEPLNTTPKEDFILRYPANLMVQWGDVPTAFASGSPASWRYNGGVATGYQLLSSLVRLVTLDVSSGSNLTCSYHRPSDKCDVYSTGSSAETTDAMVYGTFRDKPANGTVFYLGGRNVMQAPNSSHLRSVLNAFLAIPSGIGLVPPLNASTVEVARSSPVVANVDGIDAMYQGTIDVIDPPRNVTRYRNSGSDTTFVFPHFEGHLRAIDVNALDPTAKYDDLAAGDIIFDAADGIPAVSPAGCGTYFTDSCRTIFTSTRPGDNRAPPSDAEIAAGVYGSRPNRVFLTTANVASGPDTDGDGKSDLHELLGEHFTVAEAQTLTSRIHAGRPVLDASGNPTGSYESALGGVDRSTVAVIEESPTVGTPRPTMAYFGALDGMVHAVCAEVKDYCTYKGQELWAYVPRTQLGAIRDNSQRIDGSPTVADVFGDFDGDGNGEYRTILTFHTGSGEPGFPNRSPAVIALDVTEPNDPQIVWELTTEECDCDPATQDCSASGGICSYARPDGEHVRTPYDLGLGLHLAMGPTNIAGEQRHLVFSQTNNGGTSNTPGFGVKAIDTITGMVVWSFNRGYDAPRDTANPAVPITGFPGGVTAVDFPDTGTITHLIAPSLYGELWKIDASTGVSTYASEPLFRFPTTFMGVPGDFHPMGASPTIYRERGTGRLLVVGVSGGYADYVRSSWSPEGVKQFAVAVPLDSPTGLASPVWTIDLGFNRSFAQAIVSGNEIFIVTDSEDVNSADYGLSGGGTGTLFRYNLGDSSTAPTQSSSPQTLAGGAGSVDAVGGVVYAGGGDSATRRDYSADFDADGTAVEVTGVSQSRRLLWLQLR